MKWDKEVLKSGFNVIPNVLIRNLDKLEIDATSFTIIVAIIDSQSENFSPGEEFLSKKLGLSVRNIRNKIVSMERNGLLIVNRTKSAKDRFNFNKYDFSPLETKLLQIINDIPVKKESTRIALDSRRKNYLKRKEYEAPVETFEPERRGVEKTGWEVISDLAKTIGFHKEMYENMGEMNKKLLSETHILRPDLQIFMMEEEKKRYFKLKEPFIVESLEKAYKQELLNQEDDDYIDSLMDDLDD